MRKSAKKSALRKRKSSKEAKSGICSTASTTRKRCAAWASCTSRIPSHPPERSPKQRNPLHREWLAKMTHCFACLRWRIPKFNTEIAEESHRDRGGFAGGNRRRRENGQFLCGSP